MAINYQDYYKILGVSRSATSEEIQKAFRKLARLYHPDVAKNKPTAEAKFKEINEAYHVLRDPEQRRRYDELGPNWQDQATSPGPKRTTTRRHRTAEQSAEDYEFGGTGYSDFFESFFGSGGSDFRRGRGFSTAPDERDFTAKGQDIEADIMVTLEEALNGSMRTITLKHPGAAPTAQGESSFQVRLPAGLREGLRIRVAGKGHPGHGGGPSGDIYLRVSLAHHPDFTVQGTDLYYDLELAPWEAVLGVKVTIPTLDGNKALTVPAGTAAANQLRLRGLGLPREDKTRGDFYAVVRILTPTVVTPKERELWKQLAHESPFNPRNG